MALTLDEITEIEQVATNLEKWAENLSYSPPSPKIIRLLPDVGQDKVILGLLAEMPAVAQKVESDFKVLYEMHQEVYCWRGKAITEDEWLEFSAQVDTLKGATCELVDTLRQIAQKAKEELSTEAPVPSKCGWVGTWLKRHPHGYGLTGGVIFLILFFVLGLFKAEWRQWCWGVAGLAFLVLILSLLGGRSR